MIAKFKKNKKSLSSPVFLIFFILFFLLVIGFLAVTNLKISKKRAELTFRRKENSIRRRDFKSWK